MTNIQVKRNVSELLPRTTVNPDRFPLFTNKQYTDLLDRSTKNQIPLGLSLSLSLVSRKIKKFRFVVISPLLLPPSTCCSLLPPSVHFHSFYRSRIFILSLRASPTERFLSRSFPLDDSSDLFVYLSKRSYPEPTREYLTAHLLAERDRFNSSICFRLSFC